MRFFCRILPFIMMSTMIPLLALSDIKSQPIIHLVCEESPPFNYQNQGRMVGIATDIIREAFQRIGYQIQVSQYPWARALYMAQNGEADAIFCLYKTAEREQHFDFSEVIAHDTQALFVLKDSPIVYDGDLASVSRYLIGGINGYSYGSGFDTAIKEGKIKFDPINNLNSNIQKLLAGRLDMFIEGEFQALFTFKQQGLLDKIRDLPMKVNEPELFVAFSKLRNSTRLDLQFNRGLALIRQDGSYQKIIDRYTK